MTVIGSNTFTDNTATSNSGGAIYNYYTVNDCICTVTGSNTFNYNTATNGYGGAICNYGCAMNVTGSTFKGNTATSGGAIYNTGTLNVKGSTFKGNTATDSGGYGGGAIFNYDTCTVNGSTFTTNTADNSYGGAIFNSDGTLNVHFNRIVGNTATIGSAIYRDRWNSRRSI